MPLKMSLGVHRFADEDAYCSSHKVWYKAGGWCPECATGFADWIVREFVEFKVLPEEEIPEVSEN